MTKDLFDKYIWLVDTIYRAGKITFEEINERWLRSRLSEGEDIPLRTFHNWRIAIEQVFDININCNRKGGYYYYIENADDMQKGGVRNWLLNTFAVNNLINESHHLKRRILFEEIPSGRKYLTSVIEAMRDGLEIELYYQSYWYEEPSTYTLQPYCIKVFKQRWYVIGFCKERNNIRTFSLDRIQQLTTLDAKFVYPKDFDPEAYFADYFGIMIENKKLETIRIKVYGMHVQYIRALPLHRSQCEIETTVDYSIFEYRMKPTLDFRQELLSRGADVEVLAPLTFREEMIQSVEKMSSLYNKQ
ncbi:WYL domain-containing protein [Bacteroides gallinaceum]|jgi:hypothetical protein|uniref:WYL domain-containing protein n=1 Tax=Bacteroides gallinaceum TaxID=1462571 RepID=A0ABT7X4M0_9BACE|nr:WYL domain-containing protein [Bacteroides gallinaceum]MBM6658800.1 WYL domain-containing protein [Bacteroides gallinaceum]MDN0049032.1 WYL domain-containing protein [Bacteroides gallinaceum]